MHELSHLVSVKAEIGAFKKSNAFFLGKFSIFKQLLLFAQDLRRERECTVLRLYLFLIPIGHKY